MFEITSTLHACSDIGKFYGRVDNIAMKQVQQGVGKLQPAGGGPPQSLLWSTDNGLTNLLLSIPEKAYEQVLDQFQTMDNAEVETFGANEFGINARVLMQVSRGALEAKGPQRRLEEVAKAVGGGYCRLQMPSKLAPGVRGTLAGHRLGGLEGGGGGVGTRP